MQQHEPRGNERQASRAAANGAALQRVAPKPTPGPPLAELHFDGDYRRMAMSSQQRESYDGHLELWDRATQTALEVREVTPQHEYPPHKLAGLLERIAQVRGKPIVCFRMMSLHLLGEDGNTERMMEADQSLYLHPERAELRGWAKRMEVGGTEYPDVVLEVDNTTDIRRGKLKLYEAWRFPELWVEVPDTSPRATKWHGLTIRVLDGKEYEEAAESKAFPGWTAADIHTALNERRLSERTNAILMRVGAALGKRAGTGPNDDPLLREQRREAQEEGHRRGRRAAFAEARTAELQRRAAMVRTVLAARGLAVAADFPLGVPGFAEASAESVAEAAMRCTDAADLPGRLRRAGL